MRARIALLLLGLLAWTAAAEAHDRSQSFSEWRWDEGRLHMTYTLAEREATRLLAVAGGSPARALASHLAASLQPTNGDGACRPDGAVRQLRSREGHLRYERAWRCPTDRDLTLVLRMDTLFDVAPSHVHFARVETGEALPSERIFTSAHRSQPLVGGNGGVAGGGFVDWVQLGIAHILGGVDHLAFLLGLLLLARDRRSILLLVTGFTVGHSVTLGLSATGLLTADRAGIEALIGWTVALVAIESLTARSGDRRWAAVGAATLLLAMVPIGWWLERGPAPTLLVGVALFSVCFLVLAGRPGEAQRLRPALTVLFGLVHGFGFATVLAEVGLSRERLLPALLGFNIGVEVGQLAVVAILVGVGGLAVKRFGARPFVAALISTGLCALGLFWFLTRSLAV